MGSISRGEKVGVQDSLNLLFIIKLGLSNSTLKPNFARISSHLHRSKSVYVKQRKTIYDLSERSCLFQQND